MSPTCCEASESNRIVRFFTPATQSSPAHWVVPLCDEDGKPSHVGCTGAIFCPFCGTKLGREHIPFEARKPYGSTEKRGTR